MTYLGRLFIATVGGIVIAGSAKADQVFLDDIIVDGSACIGFDCVNGESFGFDTLRLKENNLRIKAQDTSSSASFPTNDWQITFNDTSNGGANKFSIDDIDGGKTPLTIEAGAPSHSLFVDSGGRLGNGTSNPVTDIHVVSGNTPTLRLEQDGSSGFGAQTWDVAGNEANFFIRDASNGSTLPFRIFPGAPSNALTIEATTGDVGIGTTSPANPLHVRQSDGTAKIFVEEVSATTVARELSSWTNNGDVTMSMVNSNTGQNWAFANLGGDFRIITPTTPGVEFSLSNTGDLTILGGLITTGGGGACTMADPCDRVFDKDVYEIPSIEEHAAQMWENMYLPAVGPTKPDQPVNMTVKMLRMLNELEKAHVYIDQLNQKVGKLTKEKNQAISTLELRLSRLENQK